MPWKECHVMDERLRFVARLVDGETMAPLCGEDDRLPRSKSMEEHAERSGRWAPRSGACGAGRGAPATEIGGAARI